MHSIKLRQKRQFLTHLLIQYWRISLSVKITMDNGFFRLTVIDGLPKVQAFAHSERSYLTIILEQLFTLNKH